MTYYKAGRVPPYGQGLAVVVLLFALLFPASIAPVTSRAMTQETSIGRWTRLAASGPGPAPRWDHTLSADEVGRRLVLVGGRDGEGDPLGDTWLYNLTNGEWTQSEGVGSSPRFGHAVAVDQEARALYLFGGQAEGATFFDDAWRLDLNTLAWQEIETSANRPPARYGTSAVLDGNGHLLISHGFTFDGRFDDTWALDLGTGAWTDISPEAGEARPLKRCLHEAVWDPAGGRMLLFGGCSSGFGPCPQGDLWAFNPATRTWTERATPDGPAARSNPALVIDAAGNRALLLHGLTADGYTADSWALPIDREAAWEKLGGDGEVPSARASHDAVVGGDRLYLFGGNAEAGVLADLWALDLRGS